MDQEGSCRYDIFISNQEGLFFSGLLCTCDEVVSGNKNAARHFDSKSTYVTGLWLHETHRPLMGTMVAGGPPGSGLWRSLRYFGDSLQFGGVLCPQSLFVQKGEVFGGERRKAEDRYEERERRAGQERERLQESQERNVCPEWAQSER